MNRSSLLPLVCVGLLPILAAQQAELPSPPVPDGAPKGLATIVASELARHAHYLASDELGGRHTATAGQIAAARYIADHFAELGLEPLGDHDENGERTFFQHYPVVKTELAPEGTDLTLGEVTVTGGFGALGGDIAGPVEVAGPFVFCGYGAPDEIPDLDFVDRIPVVVLRTKSRGRQPVEGQFMNGFRVLGKAKYIGKKLEDKGARLVLYCVLHDDSGVGDMLNYAGFVPGKPLLRFGSDAGMAGMADAIQGRVPTLYLSKGLSGRVLEHLGVVIDEDGAIAYTGSGDVATGRVRVHVTVDQKASATNVVACLRGAGKELGREAVVYSAHMDHMGTRMDGDVFNGADDNASGSAALLTIAAAFVAGEAPQRSVVFLSVSGEELGLWGSEWFSDHPTWPLADIAANVNIDMIGRVADLSGPNEISVTPSYRHQMYSTIVRDSARLAEHVDLALTIGDKFYTRSDHYNFARKGIPVVFFCDGEHEDYHQVTDTAERLDYAKMVRVTRLAYWTGWDVANAASRPASLGRQRDW